MTSFGEDEPIGYMSSSFKAHRKDILFVGKYVFDTCFSMDMLLDNHAVRESSRNAQCLVVETDFSHQMTSRTRNESYIL